MTVLSSATRCEVSITQWFRALVRKAERFGFNSRASHLCLTYYSSLQLVHCFVASICWAKREMCECSTHRICVDAVATDGFCRSLAECAYKRAWPPLSHTSLFLLNYKNWFPQFLWINFVIFYVCIYI